MNPSLREIKALTGIRGIAALWVVTYHAWADVAWTSPLGTMVNHGYLAVDLFYMLSGYVMALSYQGLYARGWTWPRYGVFLLRRIARIYPFYLVMLAVMMLLVFLRLAHAPLHFHTLASMAATNLLLIQAWGLDASFNAPSWSVSAEWAAYLLFPVFTALLMHDRRWVRGVTLMLCVIGLFALTRATMPVWAAPRRGPLNIWWIGSILPTLRCLCEFGIGLALYRFSLRMQEIRWMQQDTCGVIAMAALLVLLAVPNSDLAVVACMAGLILALATGTGMLSAGIGGRPIFFLGEISYAVYLMHWPFLRIRDYGAPWLQAHGFSAWMAALVASAVMYGGLIGLGWLVYRHFEQPARRWIRQAERWIPGARNDPMLRNVTAR